MEFIMQTLLPCLYAGAACVAFTFVFNIHGWGKLICGAGGALGWLVYLLCGQSIPAAFLAAVSISLFSEVMARVRRCPVTGYLLVALLPLVPGGGIYYAMRYCVAGETQAFLDMLLHTLGMAAALAAGEFWHPLPSGERCCTCAACAGHRELVRNIRTFSSAGRAAASRCAGG